eukprot:GILI01018390.1.p1 GENE.GILI01018390.1~~GILI01018390.1.p1  ORF type:complete len:125 (-),score=6.75 GILI01018390.1:100-474(-)
MQLEDLVGKSSKERKYFVELAAVQKRLCELMAFLTANRAATLLAKWPGNAPRAFWEAMKEGDSTEVAMAIVMDPSYGLNKLNEEAMAWRRWQLRLRRPLLGRWICRRTVPTRRSVLQISSSSRT